MLLNGDSDSDISRGLCAVLVRGLAGLTPEEVLAVDPACLSALAVTAGVSLCGWMGGGYWGKGGGGAAGLDAL